LRKLQQRLFPLLARQNKRNPDSKNIPKSVFHQVCPYIFFNQAVIFNPGSIQDSKEGAGVERLIVSGHLHPESPPQGRFQT